MEVPFLCAFPESKSWVIDVSESFSHRDHKGMAGKNPLCFLLFRVFMFQVVGNMPVLFPPAPRFAR